MSQHQDPWKAEYGSIQDFLTAIRLPVRNLKNQENYDRYFTERDSDFYGAGCNTANDVLRLMNDGWPEGRDRLNELRSQITNIELIPRDRRRKPTRSNIGDTLDINAVYSGRFDIAWRVAKRQTTQGPQRIDICANMIAVWYDHSDVLFWRGAAAITLADLLEQAGYMVRLVVNFGGEPSIIDNENYKAISCRITIKDHGMPLDITSTSSVILPGFFRALGLAWANNHSPHYLTSGVMRVGTGKVEPDEILASHTIRDHGAALAFVNDTIAKLNAQAAA